MHSHTVMFEKDFQLIEGIYSPGLVVLSVVLAVIASYTALTMNERAKNYSFFPTYLWQFFASISLAFGIWSLHYVGMFSFALPIEIKYDVTLTVLSVIPSLIASLVIFYYINKAKVTMKTALLLSIVISSGVACMHFAGMASMKVDALHHSNFYWTLLSILVTSITSFAFILLNQNSNRATYRFAFALLLGGGIAILHYGSMLGMDFYVMQSTVIGTEYLFIANVKQLSIALSLGLLLLVAILLIASLCDRYIEYRAKHYDVLTELPNFVALSKLLKSEKVNQVAVWHFEDYDFINKTYGYEAGDSFMLAVVKTLQSIWPQKKTLYRIEKNRIAVLSAINAKMLKERLRNVQQLFDEPIKVNEELVLARTVCAVSNENTLSSSTHLLEQALAVLSTPKQPGSGEIVEYKIELHNNIVESIITQDIQNAMRNGDLYIVYQPKVGISCKKVLGAEALIRWQHPTLGFLSPVIFIPILEETDQIRFVTDWIIQEVAKQKARWNVTDFNIPSISINIPASYITSKHLLKELDEVTEKYHLHTKELDLEITETTFVRNIEEAMRAVTLINEKGYGVSLDDFGTGLSSLSYLKQMPISTLKIDKSFVDSLPHSRRDCAIIRSMFVLCESLNLGIVIEGVEKEEQLQFLMSLSDKALIQGYYFSPPLEAELFCEWVEAFEENNSHNMVNAH